MVGLKSPCVQVRASRYQLPSRAKTLGGPGFLSLKDCMSGSGEGMGGSLNTVSKDQHGARIFVAYGEFIFELVNDGHSSTSGLAASANR